MKLEALQEALQHHPVIGVLYGVDKFPQLLASDTRAVIVANIELRVLSRALEALQTRRLFTIVNIDSIPGLAQDRGGVDFLQTLGVAGVVSTRGSLMSRIQSAKLLSIQKVFVTDRSNLPRTIDSVRASHAELVQLMPGPVVGRIGQPALDAFSPFIVSGFVTDAADVSAACAAGAIGVTSHTSHLWHHSSLEGAA